MICYWCRKVIKTAVVTFTLKTLEGETREINFHSRCTIEWLNSYKKEKK